MNEHALKPGARVRLQSGDDVGTVKEVENYRAVVEWDGVGQRASWHVSQLVVLAPDPPPTPPSLIGCENVLDVLQEEVLDSIASLVRAACGTDSARYRDYLERVAQRLGGV